MYQDYSEIIAKQMVEKFISYAITEIKRKEHKSSILPFCNKYIEGFLWKTLSMENIFFENLEFKPESKEIYLDNMYYGKDDWMIIHEPVFFIINLGKTYYRQTCLLIYKNP